MSKFDDEVLDSLSMTRWKSALELTKEISARHKNERRRWLLYAVIKYLWGDIADEVVYPSFSGRIYISLDKLTEEGSAEWQWRDEPPEVLEVRKGLHRMEWRLTKGGIRKHISRPQRHEVDSISPAKA